MTTLTLDIPTDEPVIRFERFVAAPPDLVFSVMTDPQHLPSWWGPRGGEMTTCEVDLRVGGGYRFVLAGGGGEAAFHGTYREIDPPRRVVQTFVYEGAPEHEAVETMVLEPVEGGTLLRGETRHASFEARDGHVASGMEGGMRETYERLDELLASLRTPA